VAEICPSRDDAQPHIVENGRCVLCYAPIVTQQQAEQRQARERRQLLDRLKALQAQIRSQRATTVLRNAKRWENN
jgi:hypothetical protein